MNRKDVLIRFRLDNDEDRKAWEHLRGLDKSVHKSYRAAVVAAVNDYFDRQERLSADPFLLTREREDDFLQRVLDTVEQGMQLSRQDNPVQTQAGGSVLSIEHQHGKDKDDRQGEMEDTILSFIDAL